MLSKTQILVVLASLILFGALYFGGSLKPKEIKTAEKIREIEVESTDINSLLMQARPTLDAIQAAEVMAIESQLSQSPNDTARVELYKELASTWYKIGKAEISATYAEKIAEIENSEEAWSIAGTSYILALKNTKDEKLKRFTSKRAVKSIENAISLNPENVQHQTNLAICYAEYPPQNNPMKGVLMLLDLNKKNPENVGVLLTLARFGMQTNQFEKVTGRLQKVLELEPDNRRANCMMAEVLEKSGKLDESQNFLSKCKALSI